jgi:prolyl-tRNA editing enzyme YbaK/EbsC (Cys-tRNA(Pro) deacylase)
MLSEDVQATPNNHRTSEQAAASHEREMQEWAKTLGISPARLKQAVSVVGITPRRIRDYLRRNQ